MGPSPVKNIATAPQVRHVFLVLIAILITSCKSSSSVGNNRNSSQTNISLFHCPQYCSCEYVPLQEDLRISCQSPSSNSSTESNLQHFNLSGYIRQLTIQDLTITSEISFGIFSHTFMNNVEELILEQVIIDPTFFLNSYTFSPWTKSLRKLQLIKSTTIKDGRSDDPIYQDGFRMVHLSNLELESLTLCDNSHGLSSFFLNSLPSAQHITIVGGSIHTLYLESFANLNNLRSLNLTNNRVHRIPEGLGRYLTQLVSLDLSGNHIEHLQEEVFVGFNNLQRLKLRNNIIRYIDTEVFQPLKALEYVDISHNEMLQIFDPYFQYNKKLNVLLMSNTWSRVSFADEETAFRSLTELDNLINTLESVETLDLSNNFMTTIPESLTHMPNLKTVYLYGNPWECTCEDRWVLPWLNTSNIIVANTNVRMTQTIWCSTQGSPQHQFSNTYIQNQLNCTDSKIQVKVPIRFYTQIGQTASLKCHMQRDPAPVITWITPRQRRLAITKLDKNLNVISGHDVLDNGNMVITNVSAADLGLYICIATYENINVTHYVHLGMDTTIFLDIKYFSILVGWITSIGFLIAVLTVQLVKFILTRYGVGCPKPSTPYNSRRVRNFFESMEQHNNSQLIWLRDNYNMQAKRIKDNCVSQLERIRESYTNQTKNLVEIRDYGTQQLHTMRDQYYDQIRRVSSYSTQQLCRVRENYLFQRNRVCKFSSHQLLRLRETYKWQAQTLNKILENLPNLNFDTCRGIGTCGRAESIYLNEVSEFESVEVPQIFRNGVSVMAKEQPDKLQEEHISLLISPDLTNESMDTGAIVIFTPVSDDPSVSVNSPDKLVQIFMNHCPMGL